MTEKKTPPRKQEPIPIIESNEPAMELSPRDFVLEPIYFNRGISTDKRIFLREGVVEKLKRVSADLSEHRMRLKIWDGWRSRKVQQVLYEDYWQQVKAAHPDWPDIKIKEEVEKGVADPNNPNRVPNHLTGGAIDLTLTNLEGEEVATYMGTDFDAFGPEASPSFWSQELENSGALRNRALLRAIMIKHGFTQFRHEWWHFDYGNQQWAETSGKPSAIYGTMDIPSS